MNNFNGSVVLPNNTPLTLQQLIAAAITARTYPAGATGAEQAAIDRFGGGLLARQSIIRPLGDIYMLDAYAGVLNGVVSANDGVVLAAGHFTAEPGGGELLQANMEKTLADGVAPGSRVLFQNTGGDVVIYLDISTN